mmetsp:Transcript_39791/g.104066  ORF Transcript_39791/g.104066 Transcript_39791/m.104066 type:complete len:230 (-) Transcript_39791:4369-5058(-)
MVRDRVVMPLQGQEHPPQSFQALRLQFTGSAQGAVPQLEYSWKAPAQGVPPLRARRGLRARKRTPPSHVAEHGDQSDHWSQVQFTTVWVSQGPVLHGPTSRVPCGSHGLPPPAACCAIRRVLLRSPPPHFTVHDVHAAQSSHLQSRFCSHGSCAQRRASSKAPLQAAPLGPLGCCSILRDRNCWPPPQVAEHVDHGLQSLSSQSRLAGGSWHCLVSVEGPLTVSPQSLA